MSLLARALLVPAILSLFSTAGVAKDIPGTPKALIGTYGKDATACRSYHRKGGEEVVVIAKDFYSECMAKQCKADILSHRATPDGFVLNLKYKLDHGSVDESPSVTRIGSDKIKLSQGDFAGETLTRCTPKDVVAGIGLPAADQANDADFGYYYARATLKLCPLLKAGPELESKQIAPYRTRGVEDMAESYAKIDMREIKAFCHDVLAAFGPNGQVAPNMIVAPRPKH
jgi:hypothetical protein